MPRKKREPSTRYYDWEGDACRVHNDGTGTETADLYRAGVGLVPIDVTDLTFKAVQIYRAGYDYLVRMEDERWQAKETEAGLPPARQSDDCLPR